MLSDADDDEDHYARPVVAPDRIEDLTSAASGEPAFDVMLTTYTLFEREGASNRWDGGCITLVARAVFRQYGPCNSAVGRFRQL